MLLGLLARFTPLHQAQTPEEREAIYRFRYSIYGTELRREYPGIDHQRGRLAEEEDERPETRLYYTGSPEQVTGTFRARVWQDPPPEIVEELSLERVPRGHKLACLERMMVRPTLRGRLQFPSMIWNGYALLAREGVDLCVITAVPGLVRHYVGMGGRPYGARLVEGASSSEVPLMILMHDVEHLRRTKSFMAPQVKKHARPFDVTPFLPLFDPGAQPLSFDPRRIESALLAARPPAFEQLSVLALRRIARAAYLLEVPAGGLVVRKGTADREMYVVLEGELRVEDTGARIGRGEPMGEVAFLGTPGVRSATVHAVKPSLLLVLRRRFLDDLAEDDPRTSYLIARNLARVVADRFAERISR
jgi:hypothetical protein